ncbi:Aureobasidin resistance protein Aur1 [Gamsiella multidivaricata]|nr:Aureobasidin resistance protein Aur1 [Gamsiella multidivaricata]
MYSMPGDPGGLTRVDDILGTNMYRSTFTASPLVFGAFPSLHSGCAWQLAFFTVFVFGPRSIPLALFYVFWIWWAAMYLGHHYVIDLVGGGIYAVVAFWIGSSFLPSVMSNDGINDFVLEKQVLLQRSPHTLTSERKEWKQMQEDSDDDTTEGSIDTIVVQMETAADANSIANTMSVMNRSYESPVSQSWNGWQGYGNWLVILSSMKSGKRVPRTSPNVSPRSQLKPALHFSPAGESTMILPNQSSYTIDDIDLETICVENDVAECAGLSLSNLASPPLSTLSIPSVAGDIQSTTAASITIAATMGTSADDSDKRSIRPAHLSIPNSPSATPAPTSLLKSTFLDPEFGTPGLNTVGSGLGLGLTGSISSALLVSTAGTSSASVNVGSKRLKDD